MIFKSYIVEQNFSKIENCKIFLFYGENQGLKKDLKEKIKKENKNIEILRLYQDEIVKNKNLLINEIINKSLFNDKKILFIEQANDKILHTLEDIQEKIQNEKIFIFADTLDKKSKLRQFFEKSTFYGTAACYQDNMISIKKIISTKLATYQGLTPNVLNFIVENTGLDRGKVNNEIEKIITCFGDKKIDPNKIDLLLNIVTNEDFNELKDAALNGNKAKTNRLLADTVFELENNVYYLNSINQRINKLDELENLKNDNSNVESLITALRPPVFWKDKAVIIEQSKKWNKYKIKRALKKTYNTELQIKTQSSIRKDLLIKNLIVELCSTANAS